MDVVNMLLVFSGFFVLALIFSLIINVLLLKFSKTLGVRNHHATLVRWASTTKPSMGGLSFFIVFLVSFVLLPFFTPTNLDFFDLQAIGLLAAVTVGFLTGLFDDAFNTRPWIKFAGQMSCGLILIISGIQINFFQVQELNYLLTLFWVVGMMNSINMLDNMDGIAGIASFGILGSMLGVLLVEGDFINPLSLLIAGIMGALAGFLFFNWHPSKMYMGDTGSQFLGIILAGFGIIFFWNGGGHTYGISPIGNILMVATAFVLPLTDTTTVFIKRIIKGRSPFVGGKDHTTHHLCYLGFSEKKVAIVFIFFAVMAAVLTVCIFYRGAYTTLSDYFLFSGFPVVVFLVLFFVALRPAPAKNPG
ncbi:MAG TPA: MraY family glycosyltransferase [Bacteroidales bacterium]|nr:MraY family glycosyltransferase [Bacteroidales bacterium]